MALVLILILGSYLRIAGISWGLPTTKYFHAATFHPDEVETFNAMKSFKPSKLDLRIKTFLATRGSAQIYATAAWVKGASLIGAAKVSSSFDYFKANPGELVKLYVAGRSMSVFFGILTILLTYILTRLFFRDEKTALLSALILAVTPLHAIWSHYIGTDAMLTFEVCAIFISCYYIITSGSARSYIIAGLLAGFAGATKYSIAPVIIVPLLSHVLAGRRLASREPVFLLLSCLAGFFIGNPYSFIDPAQFLRDLKWSSEIMTQMDAKSQVMDSFGSYPNLIWYLTIAPRYGFGIPLFLLFCAGIVYAASRREKTDILFLSWILCYYAFIALTSPWQVMRWQLPYLPFLCILSARFIVAAVNNSNKLIKYGAVIFTSVVLLLTLFYTTAYIKTMTEKDIRDVSSEWIEQNIPEGSVIGSQCIYFWNPTIVMSQYWYKETEPFNIPQKKYKMIQVTEHLDMLNKLKPEYMILTDFEYHPLLKIKFLYPHPETYPFLLAIMDGKRYTLIKSFEKKPELFGIRPVNGYYPHEFRMAFPEIKIYKRNKK